MKYLKILLIFILLGLIFSCQKSSDSIKPEILTAEYEIKTYSGFERGYKVFIEIKELNENVKIKQIVLKKRLFNVQSLINVQTENLVIDQYLPIQSQMIQNFSAPKTDNRPDGIIFEIRGKEYFYELTFKLK